MRPPERNMVEQYVSKLSWSSILKRPLLTGLLGSMQGTLLGLAVAYAIIASVADTFLTDTIIITRLNSDFFSGMRRIAVVFPPIPTLILIMAIVVGLAVLQAWRIRRYARQSPQGGETIRRTVRFLEIATFLELGILFVHPTIVGWGSPEKLRSLVSLLFLKELQWWSLLSLALPFIATLAGFTFILWATVVAAMMPSSGERLRALIVPAGMLIVLYAGYLVSSLALVSRLDLGRTIADIPGIKLESSTATSILISSDPTKTYSVTGYRGGKTASGLPLTAQLPFASDNVRLIRKWLVERDYLTFLSEEAWRYLAEERWKSLDLSGAAQLHAAAFTRDGWHHHIISLLRALKTATPRSEFVMTLDALTDDRRYHVGGRGAALLSAAYARQGVAAKAAFWRERALNALRPDDPWRASIPAATELPASGFARVRGRLLLDGRPAANFHVGLGLRTEVPKIREILKKGQDFSGLSGLLVAETTVLADGQIRLDGLPSNDYILLVAWASELEPSQLRFDPLVPPISVTPGQVVIDLGTIRLSRGR